MLLLAATLAVTVAIDPGMKSLIPLEDGWEFRWEGDTEWSPIDFPSDPPGRAGRERAEFRVRIPEFSFADPTLFVYSIDINARFLIDGEEIYLWGDPADGRFAGWPWHLIDLTGHEAGRVLTIEVYSDYTDIGLFGDILLGERAMQYRRIYERDIMRFVVCSISVVVAVIFLGIFLMVPDFHAFLFFALITFSLGIRVFALSMTRQLVWYAPEFWEYVRLASYIAMPLTVALSIGEIVKEGAERITRWIALLFAVILVVAVAFPLIGIYPLEANYGVVDGIAVITLIVLAVLTLRAGLKGNTEAAFLTVNFVIVAGFATYSILMFNGLVPWSDGIDYLMLFQLSAGLMAILIRRFVGAHRLLYQVNSDLERRVEERTRDLEEANRQLEDEKRQLRMLSTTDSLTNMRNRAYVLDRLESMLVEVARYGRKLSVALFDIDHFKRVNDEHGHQSGDLVLSRVAREIMDTLRDSDVCGRYGGEEFLVVLPETGAGEAAAVAERIRIQVGRLRFGDDLPGVTISGGVAEYDGETMEQLLKRADISLYQAKAGGRNLIVG